MYVQICMCVCMCVVVFFFLSLDCFPALATYVCLKYSHKAVKHTTDKRLRSQSVLSEELHIKTNTRLAGTPLFTPGLLHHSFLLRCCDDWPMYLTPPSGLKYLLVLFWA